jgi:hypothetical protein
MLGVTIRPVASCSELVMLLLAKAGISGMQELQLKQLSTSFH